MELILIRHLKTPGNEKRDNILEVQMKNYQNRKY